MMVYDVLKEPWIPVETLQGSHKKIGLEEAFEKAHEILRLDCTSVMEEYSLYRFLSLFMSSIYRFDSIDDILELFMNDKVDMNKFQEYVDLCKNEGVSFDLFDEKTPFLQYPSVPADEEPSYVARLNPITPSGNNSIHFNHTLEKDYSVSKDKALRLLINSYVFTIMGGAGFRSGPNGSNLPMFFIPKQDNLFKTLVLSIQLWDKSSEKNIEVWRCLGKYCPKEEISIATVARSPFFGTMFPSRMVRLILDKDEDIVRQCYYMRGLTINYDIEGQWEDYYAAYYKKEVKKGTVKTIAFRPDIAKAFWLDLDSVYADSFETGGKSFPMLYVCKYVLNVAYGMEVIPLISFGLVSNQAEHVELRRGEIQFYANILDNKEKIVCVKHFTDYIEYIRLILYKSITRAINIVFDNKGPKARKSLLNRFIGYFYQDCEKEFYSYLEKLAKLPDNQISVLSDDWDSLIGKIALKQFDNFCNAEVTKPKEYFTAENIKGFLLYHINNKEKGDENNGTKRKGKKS